MIAQIYGIANYEDAIGSWEAGADHIGILPPPPYPADSPGILPEETVQHILQDLKGKCTVILLSESDEPGEYLRIAEKYHPEIIQIAGRTYAADADFRAKLREIDPAVKIMQSVPVGSDVDAAVRMAVERAPFADYLITDSLRPGGQVGASGITHSREADREIVRVAGIPVVLAGGLGVDNAAEVAAFAAPFGLDSMTKTNIPGTIRKDLKLVEQFCEICHRF